MDANLFAQKTLKYIWQHPENHDHQLWSVGRFLGWQVYKRLTHRSLDITLPRTNIKLRCYPDSRSASAALYCGLYDHDEMLFLQRFLKDSDSFLDVGANVGIYTLLAAEKLPNGRVYSIEALPKNAARLKENLALNNFTHVITYDLAVSDAPGYVTLDLADGDSTPSITGNTSQTELKVPTDTLDNLLADSIDSLTLAKMDIEGAELLALKGAIALLQQQRPMVWILEVNSQLHNFNYTAEDLVAFLEDYDYGLYRYSAKENTLFPISLAEHVGNNLLAVAHPWLEQVHQRLTQPIYKPTTKSLDSWP